MGVPVKEETVAVSRAKSVDEEHNVGELAKFLKSLQLLQVPKRYISEDLSEANGILPHDKFADLPVINLSLAKSDPERVVREVGEAATKLGFLQVVNHNVPLELIKRHQALAHEFFSLPREVKQRAHINGIRGYSGGFVPTEWTPEVLPWRESLLVSFGPDASPQWILNQIWPERNPSPGTDVWTEYEAEVFKLCHQMHELLARSLGLREDFFHQFYGSDAGTRVSVSWNSYPANPRPDRVFGTGKHVDGNALTFLWQDDVGGLQIRCNGEWLGVRPVEGAFVINVGDLMQAWTNDRFKSVEHRVATNSNRTRLSIAAFVMPDLTRLISAPVELVDEQNPRKYRPFTAMEYLFPNPLTAKYRLGCSKLEAFSI